MTLTPDQALHIIMAIVMGLASTVFWFWAKDQTAFRQDLETRFKAAADVMAAQFALRDLRLTTIEQQLDDAREETSKQAGRVTARMDKLHEQIDAVRERVAHLATRP